MIKKLTVLVLLCILVMTSSCSSPAEKEQQNDPVPDTVENDKKEIVWPLADGIWVCEYEGAYEFIYMSISEGQNCFTEGILFSGFMEGGPISDLAEAKENVYEFTVNVPGYEGDEMTDAYAPYAFFVNCDTSRMADGVLSIAYNHQEAREFIYAAEDLDHIKFEDFYGN